MPISYIVSYTFDALFWILFVAVLLTWIPNIDRNNPIVKFLNTVAELFFAPFRMIIPPIGGLDLSPIVAFLFLGVVQRIVVYALISNGL